MGIKYVVALGMQETYDNNIGPFLEDKESVMVVGNDIANDIFMKYNYALNNLKFSDDDVIAFIHEDIKIRDENLEKKVEMVFKHRKDVGILGVYGTTSFPEKGGWWLTNRALYGRGHIYQSRPDLKEPFYMSDGPGKVGFFDNLASIDGCCFFMNGKMAKKYRFDERNFQGFHFYDADTSFAALANGWQVAVADILVEHQSEGPLPQSWFDNRVKFIEKWKSAGISFPVTVKSFER